MKPVLVAALACLALGSAANAQVLKPRDRSDSFKGLYTQVYDEDSRQHARTLRRALQAAAGDGLQVAPVENVVRSAALRGTRRPVPWPQPTFVLHDRRERPCAEALLPLIARAWTVPGAPPVEVWIRQLPADQVRQERVLELWLPARVDAANRNAEFW